MVKIRIPKPNQRPRATLEAEINRLKQELETEKSSNKQLRASIDVMQIGWDLDKQKLAEAVVKLDKCSVEKVEDLTLQSDEEIPTPTPDSINNRQSESGPVVCALCCKKTFPNLEQFRNHLKVVESNLICPFCAKRKCTCSLIKHFNKGCPNVDNLPVQTQLAREAQTQTTVDIPSTFPMQHLLARVSVKMVHTLDKSGVKRILPHITMEPFTSKVNVQNPNTIESNAALESGAGVSNVQRVPADSTDTNSILYKSLKKYVGEEISQIDINTSETPDLTSKKNKVQQTLERTTSAKTVDQAEGSTIKTNSKIVDKSGPGKKNNDEVAERSASDTKSKNEKNDTPVKKSNPEIIRHKHGKKSDKKIKKSASLDSIKQGKQIGKRLNQECKNSDVSKSSENHKIVDRKQADLNKKSSISNQQNVDEVAPGFKSKKDKKNLKISAKTSFSNSSTTSSQNKKKSSEKDRSVLGSKESVTSISEDEEGQINEDFYCSACEVYFQSVVQHLETYHEGEEVEIEDEAYKEVPDDLRYNLVCKAETETTEKVKRMLIHNTMNRVSDKAENQNQVENSPNKTNKRNIEETSSESKRRKLDRKSFSSPSDKNGKNNEETDVELYKCKLCEEAFTRKIDLSRHVCNLLASKEFKCFQCNTVLPHDTEMIYKHLQMHKEAKTNKSSRKPNSYKKKELFKNQDKLKTEDVSATVKENDMPLCTVLLNDIHVKRKLDRKKVSQNNTRSLKTKRPSSESNKSIRVRKTASGDKVTGEENKTSTENVSEFKQISSKRVKKHLTDKEINEKIVPFDDSSLDSEQSVTKTEDSDWTPEMEESEKISKEKKKIDKAAKITEDSKSIGDEKINQKEKSKDPEEKKKNKELQIENVDKKDIAHSPGKKSASTVSEKSEKTSEEASAVETKAEVTGEADNGSNLPSGAGDYWKNWRQELKNDPEKWERFIVEEQTRFKLKLNKEKRFRIKNKRGKLKKKENNDKKEFECTTCKKTYHTAHALIVHTESVHTTHSQEGEQKPSTSEKDADDVQTKTNESANKCPICCNEFTSLRQAEKHKLLHDNKDAFHCTYCPCVYQLKVLLDEHLRNEHGKCERD